MHQLHQLSSTVNPEEVGYEKLTTQALSVSSTFLYQHQYSAWGKRESATPTPSQRLGGEVREKKKQARTYLHCCTAAAEKQYRLIFLQPDHVALSKLCHSQAQTGKSARNTSSKGPCFFLILSTLGEQGLSSNLWSFQGNTKSHLQ